MKVSAKDVHFHTWCWQIECRERFTANNYAGKALWESCRVRRDTFFDLCLYLMSSDRLILACLLFPACFIAPNTQ